VKSRKVKFARSADEMDQGVAELERQNQSGLYKEQSKAKVGNMTAAQYSLEGEITSIVKQTEKTKDVFYKMTLTVYNVEEGTVEWQEEKEIRKTSKK
jgi:PBP1b-binding outer membrane lipoprotein LpoB